MSEHQCVTQARVKLTSNDYQKKKPRILDQGIYAGLNFGSLAKIQFYGWLWANLFALVPTGKDSSTTRQCWFEPGTKTAFRELCPSKWTTRASPSKLHPHPIFQMILTKEFNNPKPALVHAPNTPHSSKPLQSWKPHLGISFLLFDPILFYARQNGP